MPAREPADSNRADWNPAQYERFADERARPFADLLSLIEPAAFERAVDLGCGPGTTTLVATNQLAVRHMVGIDNSPAMLAQAATIGQPNLHFVAGDLEPWTSQADHDLVLASASLHWVPDHAAVLRRWTAALRPGGQLAVQVPANAAMPPQLVATRVAHTEPYLSAMGGNPPPDPVAQHVLEPEAYASLLHDLGYERQHVRLQVYPHLLASTRDVVEWVRGTTLLRFQKLLEPALFEQFLADYERALLAEVGHHEPYFFPFRRILMWARLAQ